MTELYARVPLWLSLDGGVRALPAAARLALYDVAVAGGSIRCGDEPGHALDALCAGAGALLDDMEALGVVEVEGGRLRLLSPDGTPSSVGAPAPRPLAEAVAETLGGGVAVDERTATKRVQALWSKADLGTSAARVAWVDSPAGARALARVGRDRAWALDLANRAGANRGRFGARTAPTLGANHGANLANVGTVDGANHGANPSPSLTLSPSEKKNETNEVGCARTAPTLGANHGANLANVGTVDGANRSQPVRDADPLTVLAEASRGGVSSITAASVRMELVTFATANRLATADFEAAGRLLSTPDGRKRAWPWMQDARRAVDVRFLRDNDGSWSRLTTALEVARAEAAAPASRAPAAPPPVRPKRAPLVPLTDAQKAELLGRPETP